MCVYDPAGTVVDGLWMSLFPLGVMLSIALMAGMLGFLGHWLLQQSRSIWTSIFQSGGYHFLTGDGRGEQMMADYHRTSTSGNEQRTPPRQYERPHDPLKW